MWFASDTTGPAHPKVIDALAQANDGHAASYGAEDLMVRVRDRIREIFEAPEAAVYLVSTGTAANALALSTLSPPWGAVYCHTNAHAEEDECGAPEFYTGGAKLTLVDGPHGRIPAASLDAALSAAALRGVHNVQPGVLTITQITEAGTAYSLDEIRTLAGIAHDRGIPVHMDGARFANAIAALGCTPAELSWRAGIDVLSFGGTKNGLLAAEAVILFDPARSWEFELRRKRGGHLFSKHRFLSAQMAAYLEDDLWLEMAARANAMGARLAAGLGEIEGAELMHPVDANMAFVNLPRRVHRAMLDAGARYKLEGASIEGPGDELLFARLVCNQATTAADVDRALAAARAA